MKLPLLLSVPHAGDKIPPEVEHICILKQEDIQADGDEGAAEIYYSLRDHVRALVKTDIARAAIDLNRAADDIGGDGVIKSHTCWNAEVYRKFPSEKLIAKMLSAYYHPYHRKLSDYAKGRQVILGIDCHTMAETGPPAGPDPGRDRPLICLSNGEGTCCPEEWLVGLADILGDIFETEVSLNYPFKGGYITRSHSAEMPWLQVEFSRTGELSSGEKSKGVLEALRCWCGNSQYTQTVTQKGIKQY